MIRRPPRSTQSRSSAASDVYKRQTSFLRTGAAAAFGPLERALAAGRDDDVTRLTRERDELERARGQDAATVQQAREVTSVLASPAAKGAKLLAARVVAFTAQSSTSATSSGGRRVTIDVGYRDGVTKDLTVIAGAGLVGRVLSLIHISEPTRLGMISYAVFCLK